MSQRRNTILAEIEQMLRSRGASSRAADQMYELFQEALESATTDGESGLREYVPMGDHEATTRINERIGPILIASAIAFAGAEIAEALRVGLTELAAECGRES